MKIKVKVTQEFELEFRHPMATLEVGQQMAAGFESAYRMGAMKDLAMTREIYRQQFGPTATVSEPKMVFETSVEK